MKTKKIFLKLIGNNKDAYLVQNSKGERFWIPNSQVFAINYEYKFPRKHEIKIDNYRDMNRFKSKFLEFEIGAWFAEKVGIC